MTKRLKGVPNLPFAPIVAGLFGVVSAILVSQTPSWMLEKLVGGLGIASVVPAAAPPLGETARLLLAGLTGLLVFVPLWLIMRLIEREVHAKRVAKARGSQIPAAEPVGEGRRRSPIRAGAELGAPFMSDEALTKGEELLLSEPATANVVLPPADAPIRKVEEETLLDLGSWKNQPEVAAQDPLDIAQATVEPTRSAPLPPVSWDDPARYDSWESPVHASAEPVAAEMHEPEIAAETVSFETLADQAEQVADIGALDPFNLGNPTAPPLDVSSEAEEAPLDLTDVYEPVTFETLPVEDMIAPQSVEIEAQADPAAADETPRPRDILDSASLLTPESFGDDFASPVVDVERGLSADAFRDTLPVEALDLPEPLVPLAWPQDAAAAPSASFDSEPPAQETVAAPAPIETSELADAEVSGDMPAQDDDASLIDLLDRLEAALARRAVQESPSIPAPANLADLRQMLSQHAPGANGPRAAGGSW